MNCNIIYILGGVYISKFRPYVAISQNILPFDWQEIWQYRFSFNFYRFVLLRLFHVNTFRKADGLVVLTEFAKEKILKTVKSIKGSTALIPHGISCNFIAKPRVQKDICEFSKDQRFRILYASTIDHYKHQWNVVFAAEQLINKGYPIELEFVGGKYDPALIKLNRAITKIGINSQFIKYVGEIPYKRMHTKYIDANAFIFASSCENMPIILLEAMAAGLPIACSNRGPMPEVLGNAGVYFDPEDPGSIANSVELLLLNQHTRETIARDAYNRVQQYSWERCAKETLTYLAKVASNV